MWRRIRSGEEAILVVVVMVEVRRGHDRTEGGFARFGIDAGDDPFHRFGHVVFGRWKGEELLLWLMRRFFGQTRRG